MRHGRHAHRRPPDLLCNVCRKRVPETRRGTVREHSPPEGAGIADPCPASGKGAEERAKMFDRDADHRGAVL